MFEKFDESVLEEGVPEEVKALWSDVEQRWDETSAHAVFVERALAAGAGGYAAACYRRHEDKPLAQTQLAHISTRLEQMLYAGASTAKPDRKRARLIGVIALMAVLSILALLFWMSTQPGR